MWAPLIEPSPFPVILQPAADDELPGIEVVPTDCPDEFTSLMLMYSKGLERFAELGTKVSPKAGRLFVLEVTTGAEPLVQLRVPEPAACAGAAAPEIPANTKPAVRRVAPSALKENFFIHKV